ncbi:hypothetical protein BDV18DRAFT_42541 [Aspergillus unguis]
MSSDSRDEAIRDAKRYVRDVVQNDWSFEFSAKPGAPPPKYPANPEPTEVLEWRLREYDSSGSELEPQFSPVGSPGALSDDADALDGSPAGSAGSRHTERRRKRRRQMEEEMSWNEGLRTWVERRDAWAGALSKDQVRGWEERKQSQPVLEKLGDAELGDMALTTPEADAQTIPRSATGESSNLVAKTEALSVGGKENDAPVSAQAQQPAHGDDDSKPVATEAIPDIPALPQPLSSSAAIPASSPSTSETPISNPSPSTRSFHDPLIPVVPSLIATSNPIRASITPAMYPSIYSKVVIQGLTPTVPINLADMTNAMVQGWKADGQWPPKPQNLVLTNDAIVPPASTKHPDTPAIPAAAGDKDRPSSPESKRKSGIASTVRKVLHFSGFHPHPFHRRGSSSQQLSHPEDQAGAEEASAAGGGTGNGNVEQAEK